MMLIPTGWIPNIRKISLIFISLILLKTMCYGPPREIMIMLIVPAVRQIISYLITIFFLCLRKEKQVVWHQIRKHIILITMAIFILFHWILMDGKRVRLECMILQGPRQHG